MMVPSIDSVPKRNQQAEDCLLSASSSRNTWRSFDIEAAVDYLAYLQFLPGWRIVRMNVWFVAALQ